MRTCSSLVIYSLTPVTVALLLAGCANGDAPPTAASPPPNDVLSADARVQGLTIRLPVDAGSDTLVTLGGALVLTVAATDAAGRALIGFAVHWASADTAVATVSDDGALRVRQSGTVQLTATVGTVTQPHAFPVVLIDGDAVRDVLDDPLVARLVTGLSPTVGARVQAALAASAGALAANAAPTLRTLGASVAEALQGADDPADRALLAVLELYVHQLKRALTLSGET